MKLWEINADTKPELNTPVRLTERSEMPTEYGAKEPPLSETLKDPPSYAKAIVGGLIAGLTTAAAAAQDGFTVTEIIGTVLAAVTGFSGVFWTTNKEAGGV